MVWNTIQNIFNSSAVVNVMRNENDFLFLLEILFWALSPYTVCSETVQNLLVAKCQPFKMKFENILKETIDLNYLFNKTYMISVSYVQ